MKRIVIDLTPVRPGGENGGAKPLALELIRTMARIEAGLKFFLLTAEWNDEELSILDGRNVRRICAHGSSAAWALDKRRAVWLRRAVEERVAPRLPAWLKARAKQHWEASMQPGDETGLVAALRGDILFCPFTAPYYRNPSAPVVTLVHDVQFAEYPQFFSEQDRQQRERDFLSACRAAALLVCPSEYVKESIVKLGRMRPENVHVVHNTPHLRLPQVSGDAQRRTLNALGVAESPYLLYPANFWLHKNHEMLVTAFGMYVARRPDSKLRLVLTGAPGDRRDSIAEMVAGFGLGARVLLPGYLDEPEFAAVFHGARALAFPSLYEGFGMPVLEAMSMGKPVLCSNRTSLPEVAGTAALLFDPRTPFPMAEALEQIDRDDALAARLAEAGRRRAAGFGDSECMARRYLAIFHEACAAHAGSAA